MRLDNYLSKALDITRSNVPKFIKDNDVRINDIKIKQKSIQIDENKDIITVNGEHIEYHAFVYYMLNKPSGYVSAVKDNIDKCVVELIDTKYDIFPIGRLDKDTEGLLILSNNGKLSHYLTSPNWHALKKYKVITDGELNEDQMKEFESGITIKDGDGVEFKTKEAKIENTGLNEYVVSISEGKFHQVKRMFVYFNLNVLYLKRIEMAGIKLDDNLNVGEYRELTDEEVELLKEYMKK